MIVYSLILNQDFTYLLQQLASEGARGISCYQTGNVTIISRKYLSVHWQETILPSNSFLVFLHSLCPDSLLPEAWLSTSCTIQFHHLTKSSVTPTLFLVLGSSARFFKTPMCMVGLFLANNAALVHALDTIFKQRLYCLFSYLEKSCKREERDRQAASDSWGEKPVQQILKQTAPMIKVLQILQQEFVINTVSMCYQ